MSDDNDVKFIDTGTAYDYPNIDTYRSMRQQGAVLQKGYIFSLGTDNVTVNQSNQSVLRQTGGLVGNAGQALTLTKVDAKYFKRFQYNPAEIQFSVSMMATDPSETQQAGGALPNVGVGAFNVSFEMKFTRDTEVYRAWQGLPGGRYNHDIREVFRRVGVMKDIYDVFRVVLAGDTDGGVLPEDKSMRALSGRAFDMSAAGSQLAAKPVAVAFNDDLVFYGQVQSVNIVFNKFNFQLVPVWATLNMTISCLNQRTVSAAGTFMGRTATQDLPSNPSGTPSADPADSKGQ